MKTVLFSSHILTDIEAIADQVAIVARGALQSLGTPAELVKRTVLGIDVKVRLAAEIGATALTTDASHVRRTADELALTLAADADVGAWLDRAHAAGAKVLAIEPRHETLEDLFLRRVGSAEA